MANASMPGGYGGFNLSQDAMRPNTRTGWYGPNGQYLGHTGTVQTGYHLNSMGRRTASFADLSRGPAGMDPNHVAYLRAHGYVHVYDKTPGFDPTNSAAGRYALQHRPVVNPTHQPAGGGHPPRGNGGGGGGGGGNRPVRVPPVRMPRGGGGMPNLARLLGKQTPAQIARAMTSQQYAGVLNGLHSNILNLRAQNGQNLADIKSWFGNALSTQAQAHTANAQAASQGEADQHAQLAGLMQAVGANNNAADPLAAMGASNSTLLQALAQAQSGYDNNMGAQIQATSASARANQANSALMAIQNLRDQRNTAIQNRGNAYITNLANARQNRLQQMAEVQNMALANKQFGLNMALGMADLQNKNIVNSHLQNGQMQGTGGFAHLQAGDRLKLQQSVTPLMYQKNAAGNLVATQNPLRAWVAASNQLRTAGYDVQNSHAARTWLSTVWRNYVAQYNRQHPGTKYKMESNGTPYPTWKH